MPMFFYTFQGDNQGYVTIRTVSQSTAWFLHKQQRVSAKKGTDRIYVKFNKRFLLLFVFLKLETIEVHVINR